MSEHASPTAATRESATLEAGLEALQSSSEFDGPVERLDGHHCNDHFAQIYETDVERFATAVPFVRHGLQQDERVMYVVEEHREPEARAALRDGGIDVDAALDAGQLSFHTAEETYLRNDSFDPDEMIEFYDDTVAAATAEHEALRIVAETTWLDGDAISYEQFMEYEAKVNQLFDATDSLALCQYDRDQFPAEFIRHIVESHPHLIYDGAVCHNVYYTPPAEVFEDDPTREVNRMLGTLRDRTGAKAELQQRDRFLQELHQITADQTRSFEEKIHALLDLGCEQFGLDVGGVNRIDPDADHFEVEYLNADHECFEPGAEFPLSDTYCQAAADIEGAALVSDPTAEGLDSIPVFDEYGVEGYIGTYIPVAGGMDRTLGFLPAEGDPVSFSAEDRTYLELMGQWLGYELNRRQREEFLRECHEITSDPMLSFETKIEHLLDLGRGWFDLDMAGLHHLTEQDGQFRLEKGVGLGVDPGDVPLITNPGDGAYCRQAITTDTPVGRADVRGTDWENDEIYEELGVTSYLGTTVCPGSAPYGTLWFGSTESLDREFTETDRTFIELMGQWVGYELNRRQREEFLRECYEITSDPARTFDDKLDALFELGCEQFDLDVGGIAKINPETDLFEVEVISGDHNHLVPGAQYPLSETYCRLVTEDGETAGVTNPVDAGFEGKLCYDRFGVQTYLGTHLEVDGEMDRTFWFLSTEPRETPITDEERTFVDLMGQWVEYELERRQSERKLERTKTRFEMVFEQSNDGIFLIDPDADAFVDVNPAAAKMTGYTRDELASLRPSGVHPDEMEQFNAFLDRVRQTGAAWSEDLHCRTKDGRDIPAEISASAITLDGRDLVLANVRHIEERKQHERYQRDLYDIVADPRASFDAKLERLLELGRERFGLENGYFNRIDAEAHEFEVVAAVGPHDMIEPGAMDSLSGTFCETHLDSCEPLAAGDVGDAGLDYLRAHHEYGLDAYFAATVHVGGDEYGTLCFASETPRDKPFTEAERTFLDLMSQCIRYELERDHREAQLEQKNDRLESFASMLAHELRNPVTIGQIYSQQLPEETAPEAVEYVTEAFDRIEDMVDVLLILTRGREAIGERTPVDLADVAHKAWDTVDAPDAMIDIELEKTIQADETYIRHLFRNLLENAVDHGGADVTVTVGELPTGFYVADDGTGIPPEDRNVVFDEGYTTAADNGGTGLGLAFVRKLAEVYEWDCTVTESKSGGARFDFRNVT